MSDQMGTKMKKNLLKLVLAVFFIVAGINHFINPQFYYPLIPDYLPFHGFINYSSGILEIILGAGLIFTKTSAWGIIILLVLFIPSHVYFVQIGSCVDGGLCVPEWVAWVRLVIIHPILILWAWLFTK
ncbi:putative membrane protein [Cecembia calidifontis]|uniref:Putative membrane protein n=2 Tax=Cecembia calidifontis TaxID=1187080 RepID=A0A4Q7PCV6_9BACT|nr:putative membrane protein [Cecembia calidifontis]